MRARPFLAVFVVFVASIAVAQKMPVKVKLTFDKSGPRIIWVGAANSQPDAKATKSSKASVDLPMDALPADATVLVLDETSGNLAAKRVADIGPEWKLTAKDFQSIGQVEVHIESKGKPVAAANITFRDGKGAARNDLLEPSANGVLFFRSVAPGNINVKVTFKINGEEQDPYSVSFPVGLDRRQPVPVLTVALPDGVATLEDSASRSEGGKPDKGKEGNGEKDKAPPVAPRSGGADILTLLFMIAVLGGLGWFVYRWIKSNPAQLKATLKKMGVEIPEPEQPGGVNPPPSAPEPAGPPPQILLGDAAPEPLGVAPLAPIAPIATPSGPASPKLVRDTGEVMKIDEGLFSVGREDGLPFSFPGESTISRRHAEIEYSGGRVLLRDLGSTNGTFVNGGRVDGEVELRPGDKVQFGSVKFRYEV